jgi:hypothetical protein
MGSGRTRDGEIFPAVTRLMDELSARGITIHDSRFGPLVEQVTQPFPSRMLKKKLR